MQQHLAGIGRVPGLVVIGDDSCMRGRKFKSRHRILAGHYIFSHWFVAKIVKCRLKRPKINKRDIITFCIVTSLHRYLKYGFLFTLAFVYIGTIFIGTIHKKTFHLCTLSHRCLFALVPVYRNFSFRYHFA